MNGESLNIVEDLISKLKEIIPGAFTEDNINVDKLKVILGESVNNNSERYQLSWAGKSSAYRILQSPTTSTLAPQLTKSIHWDTTGNIFIEGENLEVLKILQKSYYGRIKAIYIDPPYNTGSDSFIYSDKFSQVESAYLKAAGEMNETGNLIREGLFRKNNKDSGKFHSNWLNMMMPRLFLARNLLTSDGIIFVSIDDNEQANLKLLLDEIFGPDCFIGTLPRLTKKSGKSTESLAKNHDYILVYGKGENAILKGLAHHDEGFSHEDAFKEKRGLFKLNQTLDYNTLGYVKSLDYEIVIDGKSYFAGNVSRRQWEERKKKNPKDGYRWRWSKDLFDFGYQNGFIVIKDSGRIYTKTYLKCSIKNVAGRYQIIYEDRTKSLTSIEFINNQYSNDNSRKDITAAFGESIFEYSKPVDLIKKLIQVSTSDGDTILDFFAGSGTTAEAVLRLNASEGSNRNFICIQLPEPTAPDSLAYERNYRTIADLTIDRIKNVIEKIVPKKSSPKSPTNHTELGCRYFKLEKSNFKIWQANEIQDEKSLRKQLALFSDSVDENASEYNILWELLIKSGLRLSERVNKVQIDSTHALYITSDSKYLFLLSFFNEKAAKKVLEIKPQNVICLDSIFKGKDSSKTNFLLKLEQNGVNFRSV